jgi:putative transposase
LSVMEGGFRKFQMSDALWERMDALIPKPQMSPKGGRPPIRRVRRIADGIFYKLRTGCQWNAMPRAFGSSSTVHRYFQKWVQSGVFEKLWRLALEEYDDLRGIKWNHQSIDTASVKAPLGGEKNRAKSHRPRQTRQQAVYHR